MLTSTVTKKYRKFEYKNIPLNKLTTEQLEYRSIETTQLEDNLSQRQQVVHQMHHLKVQIIK